MYRTIIFILLFLSTDILAGWEKLNSNTTEWLTDVVFVDTKIGYAVGRNGTIVKTIDGGDNWENISLRINEWFKSLFFFNEDHGFIVGTNSIILETFDGGKSWKYQYLDYNSIFYKIFFINEIEGYIVGGDLNDNGIVLKTEDGGINWRPVLNTDNGALYTGNYSSDSTIVVAGRNGIIFKTTDSAVNWHMVKIKSPTFDITYLVFQGISFYNDAIWAVGDHGLILKSTDGGLTWTFHNLSFKYYHHLFNIKFKNNRGIIVGGRGNGNASYEAIILETDDGGNSWTVTSTPNWTKLYGISIPSVNRAFVVGYNGIILRYDPLITDVKDQCAETMHFNLQNFPNPFNASTIIKYSIPKSEFVTIKIYDLIGREIATLVNENKQRGNYEVHFDASDLATGVYLYSLKAGSFSDTKKLILIK
ncbi:MAG: YCF48-related protein [Melioribacter sp.]|uniref:YCF48-related protein n=1 Tax=Melioribacter sp. TaxID=2052167 RepID=UPI003BE6FE87